MKERLLRQLEPDAQRILRLATRLVGRPPVITRKPHLPGDVRGMLVRPLNPRKPYEIQFARGQERFVDHIVAHEVGHIVRLHQVPEAERLIPASTASERRHVIHQIADELAVILQRGIPDQALPELFESWYRGVCTQLASFPADLRIEAWIHREFPGLRSVQRRSLVEEVHRGFPLLAPEVAALTPPTIYRATMAMNAAQALQVAELYDLPDLTFPYRQAGLLAAGSRLVQIALEPKDEGHRSDVVAVNQWANELNLTGWIDWHPYTKDRCLGIEVNLH